MAVAIDKNGFESPLEQMARQLVPAVARLGAGPVALPHAARQVCLPRLQHEVVMIGHEATGRQTRIEAVSHLPHDAEKAAAIIVVAGKILCCLSSREVT